MDIHGILQIFKKHAGIIILSVLSFVFIASVLSFFIIPPEYKASSTMLVGKLADEDSQKMQYNDVLMNQKLVKTYVEIAKSRKIAEGTINRLSLDLKLEELQKKLTVSPAADTEVLTISIIDNDPENAAKLVNALSDEFVSKGPELMKAGSVRIVDYARVPKSPIKPKPFLNISIAAFLGLVMSLGFAFLFEYMDSTIKTVDDVENILELPVVGIIPEIKTI